MTGVRSLMSCALAALFILAPGALHAQDTVIRSAIVIDPVDGPSSVPMDVAIESGRIRSLSPSGTVEFPADATRIDGAGLYLIPGLIDVHTHMSMGVRGFRGTLEPEYFLARLAQFGVTTTLNTGWSLDGLRGYRERAATGAVPLPELFAVGQSVGAPDGWGGAMTGGFEISSVDEAEGIVARLADADVDAIKIVYDTMGSFGMSGLPIVGEEILVALIDEAHSRGLKAIVHAPERRNAQFALSNGADALVHGIIDERLDDGFIGLLKESGAVYIPTHTLFEALANEPAMSHRYDALDKRDLIDASDLKVFRDQRRQNALLGAGLPILRDNLRRIHEAGVPIAMGTDTGVSGVVAGIASHMELVLYVESAMTPQEALTSATVDAAAFLGAEDRIGRIAAGYEADLVLLAENPLIDIRGIAAIRCVLIDGEVVPLPAPVDAAERAQPTC